MRSQSILRSLVVVAMGCGFVVSHAHAQNEFVSPPFAEGVQGDSSSGISFSYKNSRTQQIDGNLIGAGTRSIRQIGFRRSSSHSLVLATARTIELEIRMGLGDLLKFSSRFDGNYKGAASTVFKKKSVKLPDWRSLPAKGEPFDLVFKFDSPFVYGGSDALIWDLLVSKNNASGAYWVDWFTKSPASTRAAPGKAIGLACKTSTGTYKLENEFFVQGQTLSFTYAASGATKSTAVVLLPGLSNPDLFVFGLCSKLHSDLALTPFVLGVADGLGSVPRTTVAKLAWKPAFANVRFYVQALSFDASQGLIPFALSNGLFVKTPGAAGSAPFRTLRTVLTGALGPSGSTPTVTATPVEIGS